MAPQGAVCFGAATDTREQISRLSDSLNYAVGGIHASWAQLLIL